MKLGVRWYLAACAVVVSARPSRADKWRLQEGASSVRIDTKVRFVDDQPSADRHTHNNGAVEADEAVPFEPASDTAGFYNRPADAPGRYPVRVERPHHTRAPYKVDGHAVFSIRKTQQNPSDGTVDSLMQCKCVSTPDCNPSQDSAKACGSGKFLCCYKKPSNEFQRYSEFFNEIEDERPMLLPGQEGLAGPFPHPPDSVFNGLFGPAAAPGHEGALVGSADRPRGPRPGFTNGPTSNIGHDRPVLVGPDGPTGIIGPAQVTQNKPILVGSDGPTGNIGPTPDKSEEERVPPRDIGQSESAQRGILVGPGGPAGIIGPAGYTNRPVLVGPGGPTGIIGPYGYGGRQNMGGPGILVGPGGPTGIIGPGRQILVGPGGPTGQIGPRRPFYYVESLPPPAAKCSRLQAKKARPNSDPTTTTATRTNRKCSS